MITNPTFQPREKTVSQANKEIASNFYRMALFEGRIDEAFELYAGPYYRQHNPLIADGKEGVKNFVAWILKNHPDAHGEIVRSFAEGDYVILHCKWFGLSGHPNGEAVVDIFRLENDKVVEHWDVIQPVPENPANSN